MSPHNAFHIAGNDVFFGPWLVAHLPDYVQLPASVRDELVEALLAANITESYVLVIHDGPAPAAADA